MKLAINNTFYKELPADAVIENTRGQVTEACFSYVKPTKTNNPFLIHASKEVAHLIGISEEEITSKQFLNVFTGNEILENTQPYAMCYGGHQFGNWAGQLGDGRAINLAEVFVNNQQWALQLKGAGATPYSRTADGLAVLRSSIREYLCSEAMYHLGVSTTRALSLSLTGDLVLRDILYNGNADYEKGAVVCRVAPSFLRFGNYEIFAARQDYKTLKTLVDYTIKHFYAHLGAPSKETYLAFFEEVCEKTLNMIVDWQRVGFVHGVMNTDNLSILGLTIDYGPYGWLEGYDYDWTPNTTDRQNKRYRYGNQPNIGLWNLIRLANALFSLIEDAPALEAILENYKVNFDQKRLEMMKSKIGLQLAIEGDSDLIDLLEKTLHESETDMTIFFRNLAKVSTNDSPEEALEKIQLAFYKAEDLKEAILKNWLLWFENYLIRLKKETATDLERMEKMNDVNPKYVLRNYMAQLAIEAAENEDYSLIDELFQLLKSPYSEQTENEKWFAKRPDWARNKVGCSMLSCSS